SCRHRFRIVKHNPMAKKATVEAANNFVDTVPVEKSTPAGRKAGEMDTTAQDPVTAAVHRRPRKFGLTFKFLLFMLVPFILIYAASSAYSLYKMKQMNALAISETTAIVWQVVNRSLTDKAESVALQARQYLYSHPDLKNDQFNRDIYFKKIANQKMGVSGYTFLYERPGPDGIWRIWAHVNPRLVGSDVQTLRSDQGKGFADFWNVFTAVQNGKPSAGFYSWRNAQGEVIQKYMVAVPVSGTPYVVAATTDTEEFVHPIQVIESKVSQLSGETRQANTIALVGGFVFLAVVILLYGRNLTARIRHLAGVADRICVGELDAEIEVSSKDEIGELENAISRMRDSIKISIERMRRRRAA
nr:HAMP domain-containing protein [Desulfobacterales bacterium]